MASPGKGMGPWGGADRLQGSLAEAPPSGSRKGTHTNPLPRARWHPPWGLSLSLCSAFPPRGGGSTALALGEGIS